VVSQKGGAGGKFTFTAAEAGDHKICFTPSSNSGKSGWLSLSQPNGGIRLTLDMAIGESSAIESSDKNKLEDITTRVKDLNNRLNDIRREQVFQRVGLRFLQLTGVFHGEDGTVRIHRKWLTRDGLTGTRSRVPRPVREHERARHPLDPDPIDRVGYHLRVAAVPSAVVLHQAEAHIDGAKDNLVEVMAMLLLPGLT
jgi:hypothetical protein